MIFFLLLSLPEPLENMIDWFNRTGGPVGFEMLFLDKDAAILGMGGIYFTHPVSAMVPNPSFPLNSKEGRFFTASHRDYVAGIFMDRLSYVSVGEEMYWGFNFEGLFSQDMELHSDVPDTASSTSSGYDASLSFHIGKRFKHLDAGFGLHLLREKIFIEEIATFSFDLGIDYSKEGIHLGLSLLNLGPKYRGESRLRLPTTWRVGAGYKYDYTQGFISCGVDFVKPLQNVTEIYTGVELEYSLLRVRAGKKFRDLFENYSAGMGIVFNSFSVDYSFVSLYNDIGFKNTFTVKWRF